MKNYMVRISNIYMHKMTKGFKFWNLDSPIATHIDNFFNLIIKNKIELDNINEIEVSYEKTNESGTHYYTLKINNNFVTPRVTKNETVPWSDSAVRQFLDVLSLLRIIKKKNKFVLKNQTYLLPILKGDDTYFNRFYNAFSNNNIELIIDTWIENILNSLTNNDIVIKRLSLSIIFYVLSQRNNNFISQFNEIHLRTVKKRNIEWDMITKENIYNKLKSTYKALDKKIGDTLMLSLEKILLYLGEDANLISFDINNVEKYKDLMHFLSKARSSFSQDDEKISDLVGPKESNIHIDAAHIIPWAFIKNQIIISFNDDDIKKMERLKKLALDRQNKINIPHNIHYLFDKGHISFDDEGKIVINDRDKKIATDYGISDNYFIKKEKWLVVKQYFEIAKTI